ncbi:MAG: ribose-phosphate diphosphokinase [Candidatus Babeliales bacterium]
MKVFATRSCAHLLNQMNLPQGRLTIKTFSDGELYIKIEEEVADQKVWVIASTEAPAEHLIELFLLLDALERAGAQIHILFTYFGYARQDRMLPGEPLSAAMIFRFLQNFVIQQTIIIHIHSTRLKMFYDFEDLILLDFFVPYIDMVDSVIAPDKGAGALVRILAEHEKKTSRVIEKIRNTHEHIERMIIHDGLQGKNVLIADDMIATGSTVIKAAQLLKEHGVKDIYVAATHGIFSADAIKTIEQSPIKRVFVTNTIDQRKESEKIEVIDCAPMLENIILAQEDNNLW